jgi:hypothetical protein
MLDESSRAVATFLFAASLVACGPGIGSNAQKGGAAAPSGGAAPSQEFDPQAFYGRELQPLGKKAIQFQSLTGETEAADVAKIDDHEGSFQVTIPIGTESPLECFVYKKPVDTGGTLLTINREAAKKVDYRLFRVAEVSLVGDYPVVYLEAQYLAKTPKGQALGELKSMFYQHPVSPMLCMHDELGYNETFRRMTKSLASSLKIADMQINPTKLVEVYLNKIAGHPAGFSSNVLLSDKSGKLTYLSRSSTFIPRSENDLMIQDEVSTELWDAEGRLLEAAYADTDAGELNLKMSLKKVGPQEYTYKGQQRGKQLSGKFKTKNKRGLTTDKLKTNLVASELLSGKSKELKLEEYHVDLDPLAPTEVSYTTESKDDRRIKIKRGKMEATATTDDKGMLEKLDVPLGGVSLTSERVLVRGAP